MRLTELSFEESFIGQFHVEWIGSKLSLVIENVYGPDADDRSMGGSVRIECEGVVYLKMAADYNAMLSETHVQVLESRQDMLPSLSGTVEEIVYGLKVMDFHVGTYHYSHTIAPPVARPVAFVLLSADISAEWLTSRYHAVFAQNGVEREVS